MQSRVSTRMTARSLHLAVVLVVVAFLGVSQVSAQDVAVGSATATVQAVLQVTADQALNFGIVYQGVPKTVGPDDDANSGIFTVTGEGGAQVAMYLELPEYISTATGDDRMNIAFAATDATIAYTAASTPSVPGAGASIGENPHNLTTYTLGAAAPDNVAKVFLGGEVMPSVDQAAGAYSADIILTAAYTGI
jgi:hypothetical protein